MKLYVFFNQLCILLFLIFNNLSVGLAQPQLKMWSLPPHLISFNPNASAPLNGSIPIQSVSNCMYDKNGSLLFFVIDNEVYDAAGNILGIFQINGTSLQEDKLGSEMAIVPVPGNCDKFYIIGSQLKPFIENAWLPFFAVLDMSVPNSTNSSILGDLQQFTANTTVSFITTPVNAFDDPANGNTERNRFGLAVTPYRQLTSDYFLYMKGFSDHNLYRYKINANGIFLGGSSPDGGIVNLGSNPALQDGDNPTYPEMELIYNGSEYLVANIYDGRRIVFSKLNYSDGTFIPGTVRSATLPNLGPNVMYEIKGLEFSQSGKYIYFTYKTITTPGSTTEHIGYVDLTQTTLTPVAMTNNNYPGANTLGSSFIEIGFDGNLYYNDGSQLLSLLSPDLGPSPSNWNSPFPFGSTPLQLLPDQIDGQDYNLLFKICEPCVCPAQPFFMNLNHDGKDYAIACLPHGVQTPVIGCPKEDVVISGFYGCVDPNLGEPCLNETSVSWKLFGPNNGQIQNGFTTNFPLFIFPAQIFNTQGTYLLELKTLCPGATDSCVCVLDWIVKCDTSCCTDSLAFFTAAQNVQTFATPGNCELSFQATGLTDCMQITYYWGDSPSSFTGPISGNNVLVTHNYTGPGTYIVCWKIEELRNDSVCWVYTNCDTIKVFCNPCYCKDTSFTNLILHWDNSPGIPIVCETSYDNIPCPRPGNGYYITGKFECDGDSCVTNPYVSWKLIGPTGTHSGNAQATPFFAINLSPTFTNQNGIYTMMLKGYCGKDSCMCEFQFAVECDTLCPCNSKTIKELSNAVNQGFATLASTTGCTVCFAPLALSDCEVVEWHLNNPNGTLLGSSIGNQTFCHSFPGPGTYTVEMVVKRFKPDGTLCESFSKYKTVHVTCIVNPGCDVSILKNPTFSEGAVPGGFYSGGTSVGWTSKLLELEILKDQQNSLDGWTILMQGNLDTIGILTTIDPICISRDTGIITARLRVKSGPPCEVLPIFIFHRSFQPNNSNISTWDSSSYLQVANIALGPLARGEWYDCSIPYNLRNWVLTDSCGNGVSVKPATFVSNLFNTIQGGDKTYASLEIDNFCMDGMLVGLNETNNRTRLHIYPNPTSNKVNLTIDKDDKIHYQITNMTSQIIKSGVFNKEIDLSDLVNGIYILTIRQDNLFFNTKIIKQ